MPTPAITGTGLYIPPHTISNDELVAAFNAYADLQNEKFASEVEAGTREAVPHSSSEFIIKASGIESRYVMDKEGVLDPTRMYPKLRQRDDDEPGILAEIAVEAAKEALANAGKTAGDVDAVIVACSNLERAYPAIAVEVQKLLGIDGFAFDMNVACSSATFGIQLAADMIKSGSVRSVLMVNPEITSGHLEWRDRDCHFIFGDVATAVLIESKEAANAACFEILSTRCLTDFSNNIRNNNGFLRRTRPDGVDDRRDMQFMQNGRKVFKEVLPLVSKHISDHMGDEGIEAAGLKRAWLHQANKSMNDFIGKKVFDRDPTPDEQPNILQEFANTSSAGSIIAFHRHHDGFSEGEAGVICSFGAGYSVGSVIVRYCS